MNIAPPLPRSSLDFFPPCFFFVDQYLAPYVSAYDMVGLRRRKLARQAARLDRLVCKGRVEGIGGTTGGGSGEDNPLCIQQACFPRGNPCRGVLG